MAEYIEREKLMAYPIRIDHYDKENGNLDFVLGIESVLEYAQYLPTVEVVRCKDCKYYNKHLALEPFCEYLTDKVGYCDEAVYMQDDDFCSYGKCGGD